MLRSTIDVYRLLTRSAAFTCPVGISPVLRAR
jgi:hypothetical protein